jgi:hypothetical protein
MADRQWSFCIIGGLAVQRWAEPRATLDADITLLTGWGDEDSYAVAILNQFESRIPDGREFALSNRILLIRASNGKDVDISLGALPFETEMMLRCVQVEFAPGRVLPCCTAEDLFVMKAFASGPRDWVDAESIVNRQRALDKRYILAQLEDLCALKEAPEILRKAKSLLGEPA